MTKLLGDVERYLKKTEEGKLPKVLERFRHTIPFPIGPRTPYIHLANFYGKNFYSKRHDGIDIQAKQRTPVISPEKSRAIYFEISDSHIGLASVLLYSDESHILYFFIHLQESSIPRKISEMEGLQIRSKVSVEQGEMIGRVGRWPFPNNYQDEISPDVIKKFGNSYHHLHIDTSYFGQSIPLDWRELWDGYTRSLFNPLLIFKKII